MNEKRNTLVLHAAMLGLCVGVILVRPDAAPSDYTPFKPTPDYPSRLLTLSQRSTLDGYFLAPILMETNIIPPTPNPETPTRTKLLAYTPQTTWEGKATSYSINGCLGCREDRLMANGEKLNDEALTIAFMRTPLNIWVRVENLDNGKSVIARVTDRGGFEAWGRIADVTPTVSRTIGLITDVSIVR